MSTPHQKIISWQDPSTIPLLEQALAAGNCSITSTDTILGFLAPLTEQGFAGLNALKGGRQDKPYLVLIASPDKLEAFIDYAALAPKIQKLVTQCWPGPVTIIFKAKPNLPKYLVSPTGTIAIRCPQHTGLLTLLASYDGLFSTSANRSGQEPPQHVEQIDPDVIELVDYIVTEPNPTQEAQLPSTIIDASDNHNIKVVRAGTFPASKLDEL